MDYTLNEIKQIVKELLKYDDVIDSICLSDYESDKEYNFSSGDAILKLKSFAENFNK